METYSIERNRKGGKVIRIRPVGKPVIEVPALYSLYIRNGKQWKRCRTTSFPAANALLVWGNEIASNPKLYSVRPIVWDGFLEAK